MTESVEINCGRRDLDHVERAWLVVGTLAPLLRKDLKDDTLTLADWAERKRLADEMVQHARSIALDAERMLGRCLNEMEEKKAVQA
jgi:hypothetical protein